MGRNLKILIGTIADLAGITRLGRAVSEHSRAVRALGGIYRAAARAGSAAFRLVGSAIGAVNAGLRRLRNYSLLASAALTAAAVKGTKEFMAKNDAVFNLAATVRTLGHDVDSLLPRFNALADEMQEVTRTSDDETRALIEVLLNLGVMPDAIDDAVRGSIGLAKVMRTDAASAARYYAIALEGDYTMLRRYIPALRSATSDSERLAIVQRVMAVGFDQAREAAGNAAGRFAQLQNRIGDLWARFGQAIAEAINLEDALHRAERAVKDLIESGVWDRITDGLRRAFDTVLANIRTVRDFIGELRSGNIGQDKILEIGKTVVTELVTIAVVALGQALSALQGVVVGLAKVMAAAFAENILHLPMVSTMVRASATRELRREPRNADGSDVNPERVRYLTMMSANIEQQAQAMRESSATVLRDGVNQALAAIPGAVSNVGAQVSRSRAAVASTVRDQTGFDFGGAAESHRETIVAERIVAADRAAREKEQAAADRAADRAAALDAQRRREEDEIAAFQRRQATAPLREELTARQQSLSRKESADQALRNQPLNVATRDLLGQARQRRAMDKERQVISSIEATIAQVDSGNEAALQRILAWIEAKAEKDRAAEETVRRLPL
jgi:hypothetical protein